MNLRKMKQNLIFLLGTGALALEISLFLDMLGVLLKLRMTPVIYIAVLGAVFALLVLCKKQIHGKKLRIGAILLAATVLSAALMFGVWYGFQKNAAYRDADTGKEKLYAERSVMVIVPHQDDEINVLGGVLEEFCNYGSTVRIVYTTNGDYLGRPFVRMQEAIHYAANMGIPKENVIFLGYGDQWDFEGPDIYNADPQTVLTSHYGARETYGMEGHPAYTEGRSYTLQHYCEDVTSVILEYKPELIFAIDYDKHVSHMSTSLIFDRIMGQMLQQNPGYQPLVYKAYAYGTAWYAVQDFFAPNIASTQNLFDAPYSQNPAVYSWENRLRLPVDGATLSRSLVASDAYRRMTMFDSERAQDMAMGVVNGDRVFWQRRTDSLCTAAEIHASSGNGQLLNNFMLVDNADLREQEDPFDSVWTPAPEDENASISVQFQESAQVHSVVLYDHPSLEQNVLDAELVFSDGTTITTGPLNPSGSATQILVNKTGVSGFEVKLTQTQGSAAGLTEVEAYAAPSQGDLPYVKLMDVQGNFAYDFWVEDADVAAFYLHTNGSAAPLTSGNYTVSCDNDRMEVRVQGDMLTVTCPEGETGVVTVEDPRSGLGDSIVVSNPGKWKLLLNSLGQELEEYGRFRYRQMMAFRLFNRVAMLFGVRF